MGDPLFAKYPDLQLSQHIFQLTNPSCTKTAKQASLKSIQDAISEHKMAPLYRYLAHPVDGVLNAPGEGSAQYPTYESLKAENEKELEAIQKEEDEAAEKAGETEVQAARGKRAEYFTRIGDKVGQSAHFGDGFADQRIRKKPLPHSRWFSRKPVS